MAKISKKNYSSKNQDSKFYSKITSENRFKIGNIPYKLFPGFMTCHYSRMITVKQ